MQYLSHEPRKGAKFLFHELARRNFGKDGCRAAGGYSPAARHPSFPWASLRECFLTRFWRRDNLESAPDAG